MALFRSEGFDELIDDLSAHKMDFVRAAPAMLKAGSDVVVDCWKRATEKHKLVDTGDMINSIAAAPVKGNSMACKVYPQGVDRKGIRNAEKAFVNHYGTSSRKATHFVDDAEAEAEAPAVEAMANAWDTYFEQEG